MINHNKNHSPRDLNPENPFKSPVELSQQSIDSSEHEPRHVQVKSPEHFRAETENAHNLADTEQQHRERASQPPSATERHRGPIRIDEEFTHTLVSIQHEMSPAERTFSRFIHTKPIEATSDFLAATLARPNAMLAGSICAFICMLALYLFTKSIGYTLSGFELIVTFAIGWVAGMLYDYIRSIFVAN